MSRSRTPEEIVAIETEVLSDAVVAALHALMDITSTGTESADTRMVAASQILSFAWEGPDFELDDEPESEEVADGDNSTEG